MKGTFLFSMLFVLFLGASSGLRAQVLKPEVIVSNEDMDEYRPAVAYNSVHHEYLVVFHDHSPIFSRSVMGKRLDEDGHVLATFTIAYEDTPPRDNAAPDVAYDAAHDQYLVVWTRDFNGDDSDWDVYGRIIPWDGPVAGKSAFSICSFTSQQRTPRVAYADTSAEFMVTWWNEGYSGGHSYISGERVSTSGTLIGSNFTVTSDANEERFAPDIAYCKTWDQYLIVYQRMDDVLGNIYSVRLNGTGTIQGSGDVGIAAWSDAETAPRVSASQGTFGEWMVVWQSDVSGMGKEVYGRTAWVGTGVDTEVGSVAHIAGTSIDESFPDIAADLQGDSNIFLVSWEQQYANSSGYFGIHARTLTDSGGIVLGAQQPIRTVYTGGTINSSMPAVAGAPSRWFVAWDQERSGTTTYLDIYGRAVFNGIFADGFESGSMSAWTSTFP